MSSKTLTADELTELLRALLQPVLQSLVDNPDEIQLAFIGSGTSLIIEVRPKSAMAVSQLVGKGGKIATAIRAVLGAICSKHSVKMMFQIVEPVTDKVA